MRIARAEKPLGSKSVKVQTVHGLWVARFADGPETSLCGRRPRHMAAVVHSQA
jgi:hypothetical protein